MIIAINPMPVFDDRYYYRIHEEKQKSYICNLARFIDQLVKQELEIVLFNHHPTDLEVIGDIRNQLQEFSESSAKKVTIIQNETVNDLVNTISRADAIVATRFHGIVLPLGIGKPVLGICYYRKSRELLEEVGLGAYCVDINKFTDLELMEKFNALLEKFEPIKAELKLHHEHHLKRLDEQWNYITSAIQMIK